MVSRALSEKADHYTVRNARRTRPTWPALFIVALALMVLQTRTETKTTPEGLALQIADYATLPMTGSPTGTGNNAGSLARINFMREEPARSRRFFVNDLNGPLYILNRATKNASVYLDFNGRGVKRGLFDRLATETGLASGFISFEFDPDYVTNGRFYTIHLEDLSATGPFVPDNAGTPGLDVDGYQPTPAVRNPPTADHESVVIEWTDSNISNATFEGSARELLRVQLFSRIHPMGDLTFNPMARPGDPDWRVLYVASGDGGAGDYQSSARLNPQRLDTLVGKVLRIVPDLSAHRDRSIISENGRYRVPKDNPFVSVVGARPEVWAYGLRNPHRLNWDVDRANPATHHLVAAVTGWKTWETVVIVRKGGNYGYPAREGTDMLEGGEPSSTLPDTRTLRVQVSDVKALGTVSLRYPVIQYGHGQNGGDAIAGGFVYRGNRVPRLRGKYVFGDISTGRLWYADFKEMLAADDDNPLTQAQIHELPILWDNPSDSPNRGQQNLRTLAPIVQTAYHARGGKDPDLPGMAPVSGSGRVDLRLAQDRAGELYLLSKSDGMIRIVTGFVPDHHK